MPPEGVLDRVLLDEVDLAPENRAQVVEHLDAVVECNARARRECYKHVDVAVRAKILAQDLAKKRKFRDPPLGRERGNLLAVNPYADHTHLPSHRLRQERPSETPSVPELYQGARQRWRGY